MIIYNPDDTLLLNIEVDDSSYAFAEVMNRDDVTLEFSLAEYVNIPLGAYITYGGRIYQLLVPAVITVVNRRNYGYTATFESDGGKLRLWRIHNPVDGRVKFTLTARPSEHLAMFVANLNEREGATVWAVAPGSYDSEEITLSYNQTTILDSINQLANQCQTEWEVFKRGSTIYLSLGKVEYNADAPLALSYGSEGGFESGVRRTNSGDGLPIQVLYVQGGDRNIDPSTYYNRSHYLLLPRGQNTAVYSFLFDGEHFDGEAGFDASKAVAMRTDANGYSVRLADAPIGAAEASLDLSDIYPKRVGTVSAVETEESDGDYPFYNIIDDSLGTASGKLALDYNEYLIEGETFTVVFQSGMLVGREIGVSQYILGENGGTFKLCQEQIDGFIMPGEGGYVPQVGDTYAVFGCALPAEYLRDFATKTGAEFDMLRQAARYLYENKDAKQSFTGVLSSVFARKNWTTIGPKIVLGGYVSFTDESVQTEAVSMRIMSIKTYINCPYKPEITLSNEATKGTVGGSIQHITNNFAHTDRQFRDEREYTNRRWRDAKEGLDLLGAAVDSLSDDFTEGITPVTIQTMGALVGSTNLQYEVYTTDAYTTIQEPPYFNDAGNLVCPAGYVKHFTLGFSEADYVKSGRPITEFYRWSLAASTLSLADDGAYYLYIAASKMSSAGQGTATYLLSRTPIPFAPTSNGDNYDTSHYYLLYGTISSEIEGSRSIATYNGFTEITPGMIRAMKFISNDGQQYIDFINKTFRIGDANTFLGWNVANDGQLRLRGTIVQSQGGTDESPLTCFRGAYSATTAYYYGDEVTFGGETWWHKGTSSTTGVQPTEGAVWTKKAAKGSSVSAQYSADGTNWHDAYADNDIYMRTSTDGGTTWGAAMRIVGEDGSDGPYTDFAFAYSPNLTSSQSDGCPTNQGTDGSSGTKITAWSDTPPAAVAGQYLWIRTIKWELDSTTGELVAGTPGYARIDGASAVVADLDNEMDAVGVGPNGILELDDPTSPLSLTTTFRMYLGTVRQTLTALTATGSSLPQGVTLATNPATGIVTITIADGTTLDGRYPITITGTSAMGQRELVYTLVGVKTGADGANYKIIPSHSAISVNPNTTENNRKPATLTCEKKRIKNGTSVDADDCQLRYSIDGSPEATYPTDGSGIPTTHVATEVVFTLYLVDNSGSETLYVLVDQETVPVVKDGTNGTGSPGRNGKSMRGISTWKNTGYDNTGSYQGEYDYDLPYYDVVRDDTTELYYKCRYDVNPTSGKTAIAANPANNLVSDATPGCFVLMNNFENIATKAAAIDEAAINKLNVKVLRTEGERIVISDDDMKVEDSSGNTVTHIHSGSLTAGDTGTTKSAATRTIQGELGNGQIEVNILGDNVVITIADGKSNNKVAIPVVTLNASTTTSQDATPSSWSLVRYATNGNTVLNIGDGITINGSSVSGYSIPAATISLPVGSWEIIYILAPDIIAEDQQINARFAMAADLAITYPIPVGTEIAGNAFRSVWSDATHLEQGFIASVEGAKVVQDGVVRNALGSTTGKGFEFVGPNDSYPADSEMVEGILYIKFGS